MVKGDVDTLGSSIDSFASPHLMWLGLHELLLVPSQMAKAILRIAAGLRLGSGRSSRFSFTTQVLNIQ